MRGTLDQDIVTNTIAAWLAEPADDFWLFRPSNSDADEHLLLVHQAQWQRWLMLRYGQQLAFLDATYKTTQYALPLFFLWGFKVIQGHRCWYNWKARRQCLL